MIDSNSSPASLEIALYLKLQTLREDLPLLSYELLVQVMESSVWKAGRPHHLSQLIDDIYQLECEDVVSALMALAQRECSLDTIYLGGNDEETNR